MKEELNFHKDVKIDPLNLIEEWENQATLYHDYDEKQSDAIKERDLLVSYIARKEREIKLLRCDLSLKVRKDPDNYGLKDKPSENSIREVVLTQKEVKKAYNELFDMQEQLAELNYSVNVLSSGAWGMVHRKDALHRITDLYLKNYYATEIGTKNFDDQVEGLKKTIKKKKG